MAHPDSGWSVSIGELRKAIQDIPDDYELVIDGVEVDCDLNSLHPRRLMHPVLDKPGLLVMEPGMPITSDYEYHPRLDVWLEIGGEDWSEKDQKWVYR